MCLERFSEKWGYKISDTMELALFECRTFRFETEDVVSVRLMFDDIDVVFIISALSHFLIDF